MVMDTTETTQEICFQRLGIQMELSRHPTGGIQFQILKSSELLEGDFDPSQWTDTTDEKLSQEKIAQSRHRICNRLHVATMALDILQSRSDQGDDDLGPILEMAMESLSELDRLALDSQRSE